MSWRKKNQSSRAPPSPGPTREVPPPEEPHKEQSTEGGDDLLEGDKEGWEDTNKVQHGRPSTKEGKGRLAGPSEGSDKLNEKHRRMRRPELCSPEDFKYKRQRIEEEGDKNTAPRRGHVLEEIHHGGPHARKAKKNNQRIIYAEGSSPQNNPLQRSVNPSLTPTSDLSGSATSPQGKYPPCDLAGTPAAGASILLSPRIKTLHATP